MFLADLFSRKVYLGRRRLQRIMVRYLETEGLAPGKEYKMYLRDFRRLRFLQIRLGIRKPWLSRFGLLPVLPNVQIGMSDYAGQSGRQTELLIQRAKENSSINAILFNEYKRDQAYIMFLFAMFYYENENFIITEHGYEEDNTRPYMNENSFNGPDYIDDDVIIDIRVGLAPAFSEYANIEIIGLAVQSVSAA